MPPGRKPSHTPADFVHAAIDLADSEGIAAVKVRSLGTKMNVSSTAIYRYFAEKDKLLAAMRDDLLHQALTDIPFTPDPRLQILAMARAYRRTAQAHPCMSELMILTQLSGPEANKVPQLVAQLLEQIGIRGELLVRGYRQLESLIVGTTLFDYAGAPLHLSDRLNRLKTAGHTEMINRLTSDADIEAVNEAAFDANIQAVVDSLIAQSQQFEDDY